MSKIELRDVPRYTYNEYKLWKGDWELMSGIPIAMSPSPMITHQSVCSEIHFLLKDALEDCPECEVLYEIDWVIDEENVLRPDIVVICDSDDKEYVTKAPKIIFEVISKSTAHNDRVIKHKIYEEEGVLYYAIVDPDTKVAKVYVLKDGRYIKLIDASTEKVKFTLGECELEVDFGRVWKGIR